MDAHRRCPDRLRKPGRLLAGLMLAAALALTAAPALADEYDPNESGHPVRIIAYALHPVGVVIDTLVFRPAHWLVHRASWIETLFGHTSHD